MDRFYREELYNDKGHKIRHIKNIIEQIKRDFSDLNGLMERLKSGIINSSEIQGMTQKISWIKQEINMLEKLNSKNIEGILWGEMIGIKKNIIDMEMNIKILQISHFL